MPDYQFCTTKLDRKGNVKASGRIYHARDVGEGGVIPLRSVNIIRVQLDGRPLQDGEGLDGFDVSGAGKTSPYQIIYRGSEWYCVPYNEAYVRTRSSSKSIKSRELKYPIPIYKLAENYGIEFSMIITICTKFGFGENLTEYSSLTQEQAERVIEKLDEFSEIHK